MFERKVVPVCLLLLVSLHTIQQISAIGLLGGALSNLRPKECEPHLLNMGFRPLLHGAEIIAELRHIRNMLQGGCAYKSPAASLGLNTLPSAQMNENSMALPSIFETLAQRNAIPAASP